MTKSVLHPNSFFTLNVTKTVTVRKGDNITRFITSQEIAAIAEIKPGKRSREILKKANETCELRGYIVPNRKKAPRDIVLELLGLARSEKSEQITEGVQDD